MAVTEPMHPTAIRIEGLEKSFKDVQALRMQPDDLSLEPYAIVLPPITTIAQREGMNVLLDMSELGAEYQITGLASSQSFISKNRPSAMKLMRSFVEYTKPVRRAKALVASGRTEPSAELAALNKTLKSKHKLVIDGGYGKIKGTTFRVSNMGDETEAIVELFYAPGTLLDEVACLSFSTPSKVIGHIRATSFDR
jgi:aspartate aminotransferase-like enzyme